MVNRYSLRLQLALRTVLLPSRLLRAYFAKFSRKGKIKEFSHKETQQALRLFAKTYTSELDRLGLAPFAPDVMHVDWKKGHLNPEVSTSATASVIALYIAGQVHGADTAGASQAHCDRSDSNVLVDVFELCLTGRAEFFRRYQAWTCSDPSFHERGPRRQKLPRTRTNKLCTLSVESTQREQTFRGLHHTIT